MLSGEKEDRKYSVEHMRRLCVVGFPMGFEYSISAVCAVIMCGAIKHLGSVGMKAGIHSHGALMIMRNTLQRDGLAEFKREISQQEQFIV